MSEARLSAIDPDNPGPAVGPFSEQRSAFNRALESLLLEGGDPQQIIDDTEAEVNDALEAYVDANF